jgi:transposase InsO family protein
VWIADISYLPTDEGFLYLAAMKGLCTKKIVGWSMSKTIDAQLAVDALIMAIARQRPGAGLIVHSDRGSQYASAAFRSRLEDHCMRQSMSRRGNCYDNAPMESFLSSLKGGIWSINASARTQTRVQRYSPTWKLSIIAFGYIRASAIDHPTSSKQCACGPHSGKRPPITALTV